jgi:hypothetical protein
MLRSRGEVRYAIKMLAVDIQVGLLTSAAAKRRTMTGSQASEQR